MESSRQERLQRFFSARHIAVIGATTKNVWFANALRNADRIKFAGSFYPVNPTADEVFGIKAYKTIAELPENIIDFAVIMVKAQWVPDILRQLKGRGIDHVLLLSSGYGETGAEGREKQRALEQYCREQDILLMGPNCLGFMNFPAQVSVFVGGAVEGEPLAGNIGVIGQSGATSEMLVTKLQRKNLGISVYATTGNEALLTAEDCLEYLVNDGETRVITGFLEGFRNIPKLEQVAREAARRQIPIILVKVGRSAKAIRAAQSHTGALAGNDAVMDGIFRQWGIIRADTIEELVETAGIFARCPLPTGTGLGIYTLSGGLCGIYADLCAKYGIELSVLRPETIARLKAVLPGFAQPDNPLDLTGAGFQSGVDKIAEIILNDESVAVFAPLSIPPTAPDDTFANAMNSAFLPLMAATAKPLVPITFREINDYAREYYHQHGIFYIEQPDLGFKAIAHLINYAKFVRGLRKPADADEA